MAVLAPKRISASSSDGTSTAFAGVTGAAAAAAGALRFDHVQAAPVDVVLQFFALLP